MLSYKVFKDDVQGARLYLIATPIGNISDISSRAKDVLSSVDIVLAEDTRNTSYLLSRLGIKPAKLISCYSQKEGEVASSLFPEIIEKKLKVAFVSDAGTPGISDPGELLVKKAWEMGLKVVPIPGPAAFVQALIVSGFETSDFSFYGFPPSKSSKAFFETLINKKETLIFYEAPHRLEKTLNTMLEVFGDRNIFIGRELTKVFEEHIKGSISEMLSLNFDDLKGEICLVLEGNKNADSDEEKIKQAYKKLSKLGYSSSEAAKIISELFSLRKNYIYKCIEKFK